jgi:hypothetical protein
VGDLGLQLLHGLAGSPVDPSPPSHWAPRKSPQSLPSTALERLYMARNRCTV